MVSTHLKGLRRTRGLSAADLARRAGVSRQTIYAIEDGSFLPNTAVSLQLARALDVRVEEIFSLGEERAASVLKAELLGGDSAAKGQLVRVCQVRGKTVAVPNAFLPAFLPAADGIIESKTKGTVSIRSSGGGSVDRSRLLVAGCDPALSLLEDALRRSGIEIVTVSCSSRRALEWLKQGKVHVAGSHLRDRATGNYNVPIIRRFFNNASIRMFNFAVWEEGLVVRQGNLKSIRSIGDLAENAATIMNREKGSGSRDLLDRGLREFGISPQQVRGYNAIAPGHMAAAYAVAVGNADCCIAPRSAARCFGLDFVPLSVERFDLSFTRASLELAAGKALLEALNHLGLRKSLQCIAGYDTAHTGEALM
ncbi:MAG: helix-turn-helix domain-containing protein [Acidobacteriaceae bacterium]|nr:helix-turn-helix domain-containing protein [Acidobacteriaceae bacterium]